MIYAQLSRDLENPINVRIPLGESWFSGKSATSCEQLSFKTCSEIIVTQCTESKLPQRDFSNSEIATQVTKQPENMLLA